MVSTNEIIAEAAPGVNLPIEQETSSGPEGDFEKAQKKYQLGKKNLLLNKYDDAVNNIGEACKVYSSKFGELAPECAEVYFYYGKGLLELARVENTVLGNALSGVPEDTGPIDDSRYGNPDDVAAEEKEEIADKVIDAMCETDKTEKPMDTDVEKKDDVETVKPTEDVKIEEKPIENGDKIEPIEEIKKTEEPPSTTTTTTTIIEEKKPETEAAPIESTSTENGTEKKEEIEETCEEDGDDEDDEAEEVDEEDLTKNDEQNGAGTKGEDDDISNLQRAWEMFELAKLIFSKNFDNDPVYKSKRIAECLIKLGEISIEQELYEQALTDIKESIRMQEEKQANERDERMLAESYYQFGLAYQFSEQFQLAGDSYQKSINILQLRIDKLKGLIEQSSDDFEKNSFKDEITELEAILPEMVSKLEEIKEQGEQSLKLIKEAKECFINKIDEEHQQQQQQQNNNKTTNGSSTEVKDITSLVKSKRKISDNTDETAIKKTKVDDEKCIEQQTTTTTNGTEAIPIETDPVPIETEIPTNSSEQTIAPDAPIPIENGTSQ